MGTRRVIGHHLIFTGYGHWLPNDPRGSGSVALRDPRFAELGAVHRGRRPAAEQPTRAGLRATLGRAGDLLTHEVRWFGEAERAVVAEALGAVVRERGYTCWAAAVLSNHAHAVVRVHRDRHDVIWRNLADAAAAALRGDGAEWAGHPVWSARVHARFCFTPGDLRARVAYVEANPAKEGLAGQAWDWVAVYDGWPHHG